jgi:hypothetical protein
VPERAKSQPMSAFDTFIWEHPATLKQIKETVNIFSEVENIRILMLEGFADYTVKVTGLVLDSSAI